MKLCEILKVTETAWQKYNKDILLSYTLRIGRIGRYRVKARCNSSGTISSVSHLLFYCIIKTLPVACQIKDNFLVAGILGLSRHPLLEYFHHGECAEESYNQRRHTVPTTGEASQG